MWSLRSSTDVKLIIAINAIDIRGSFKRIVDSADLNESEGIYSLEKARCAG